MFLVFYMFISSIYSEIKWCISTLSLNLFFEILAAMLEDIQLSSNMARYTNTLEYLEIRSPIAR